MKRCRFNKLVSLYLDKEINPEELHELNQELEQNESSRNRFKAAIIFDRALRERESFSEVITSPSVVTLKHYLKWGTVSLAALLFVAVCFQMIDSDDDEHPVYAKITTKKSRPIILETKATISTLKHLDTLQASFSPMNWEHIKRDLESQPSDIILLRKEKEFPEKRFNVQGAKITQVNMKVQAD